MLLAISQRQDSEHGGVDALEASYIEYFDTLGVTLIPIPNHAKYVKRYFTELRFDGVVLSGGGDIQPALYGGNKTAPGNYAPEREETEQIMLTTALQHDIPVLGICRGMEYINVYFGGAIQNITSVEGALAHDETRHDITIVDRNLQEAFGKEICDVNSYHRMVIGAGQLSTELHPFAIAPDHTVEGFYHPDHAVAAIVWHPERETIPHTLNDYLVDAFLSRKLYWQRKEERRGTNHE